MPALSVVAPGFGGLDGRVLQRRLMRGLELLAFFGRELGDRLHGTAFVFLGRGTVPAGIDTEGVADVAGLGDCANSPAAGSTVQAVKRASV